MLGKIRPNVIDPKFRLATSYVLSVYNTDFFHGSVVIVKLCIYSYDNVYNSITIEVSLHTKRLTRILS